jgi:NADPH:quinone reductase-like Zn-dependent oxidoreductase
MKAAVIKRYGSPDVIKILDVPKPTPAADQLLIRVHAATVNRTDCGELRAHPFFARLFFGLRRPRRSIFGLDFAGVVEAVGAGVVAFKQGDRVFGMCPSRNNGAQAEYVAVPERAMAAMPAGTQFDEAVVCEGAFYANAALQRMDLKPGQKILIYGASGAIGTAMIQLAKSCGAAVTAVVGTRHLELVKSLGADQAVDYTSKDFTRIGETFDFVVDAVGKTSFFRCRKLLKPGGLFAATDLGPWAQNVVLALWSSITRSNRVVIILPGRIDGFVGFLRGRMEAGQFKAVIDRKYTLAEISDAYRYVETGQKVGIVVINVAAAEDRAHAPQDSRIGSAPNSSNSDL